MNVFVYQCVDAPMRCLSLCYIPRIISCALTFRDSEIAILVFEESQFDCRPSRSETRAATTYSILSRSQFL